MLLLPGARPAQASHRAVGARSSRRPSLSLRQRQRESLSHSRSGMRWRPRSGARGAPPCGGAPGAVQGSLKTTVGAPPPTPLKGFSTPRAAPGRTGTRRTSGRWRGPAARQDADNRDRGRFGLPESESARGSLPFIEQFVRQFEQYLRQTGLPAPPLPTRGAGTLAELHSPELR